MKQSSLVLMVVLGLLAFTSFQACKATVDQSIFEDNTWKQQIGMAIDSITGWGVPYVQHQVAMFLAVSYEAVAVYDNTAVPMIVPISAKRLASEKTLRNKNIALAQAAYRVAVDARPASKATYDQHMIDVLGMDPTDMNTRLDNPVGMGNYIFDAVVAKYRKDGANKMGDITLNKAGDVVFKENNRLNFSDYTGYVPVNSVDTLTNVDKWQPLLVKVDSCMFLQAQMYKGAQFGLMNTTSGLLADDLPVPRQTDTFKRNRRGYVKKVNEVLQAAASLTDSQKMTAEWHDDKLQAISQTLFYNLLPYGLDYFVKIEHIANQALLDAFKLMWNLKTQFDAVRPETAVKVVYGDKMVTAWAKGKGTTTMYGREWKSYLATDAFPEYPSGTTCLCTVVGRVLKRFLTGREHPFFISKSWPKGSSVRDPGVTPANDLTLSWNDPDQWVVGWCSL